MIRFIPLLLCLCGSLAVCSQQSIRLMSYNLLNFPSPNPVGRLDTLEKIVAYYQPDLLMIQELKSSSGLSDITDMMDDLGYGSFAQSQFVPQQSNPVQGFTHQQAIVYNLDVFRLKTQDEIITEVRDINEFVLYLNDPELENGADTVFLYVYVAHLKSADTPEDAQSRLDMVNAWRSHVEDAVPPGSSVIFAGDFNLYGPEEEAYIALTANSSPLPLRDVFASYGDWSTTSFAHKEILTQSTRVAQLFGDGAGGGLDDRFDFILFSDPLLNDNSPLHLINGTMESLGNNGTCYNQNITACATGNEVPPGVLRAIYFMSDHIPQVCELTTSVGLQVENREPPAPLDVRVSSPAPGELRICLGTTARAARAELLDLSGRSTGQLDWNDADECRNWATGCASGIYLLRVENNSGMSAVQRVVVH